MMRKITILLALTLCTLAQEYTISKNANNQPCFDEATEINRDDDYKKFYEDAKNLADHFNRVNGTADEKYDLFESTCKEIKAQVVSAMRLPNFPLCKVGELPNVNNDSSNKTKFAEEYFDFMCNLKKSEYRGFIEELAKRTSNTNDFNECLNLIMRSSDDQKEFFDYCGNNVPEMLNCAKRLYAELEDSNAFFNALVSYMKRLLCSGEFIEEKYLQELDWASMNIRYHSLLIRMLKKN